MRKNGKQCLVLGISAALLFGGCQAMPKLDQVDASSGTASESVKNETTVLGQVTKVSDNSITLALGTQKEMQKPDGNDTNDSQNPPQDSNQNSGENSSQSPSQNSGQTPPQDSSQNSNMQGNPPENQSGNQPGDQQGGQPPERPSMLDLTGETKEFTVSDSTKIVKQSSTETVSLSEIKVDDVLQITLAEDGVTPVTITIMNQGGPGGPGGAGGPEGQGAPNGDGGSENASADLKGAFAVDGSSDSTNVKSNGKTYTSSTKDENAVLVSNGGSLEISNAKVKKSGDSSNVNQSNFTGLNAAVAVTKGSTLTISDTKITSTSEGSNAVFATGKDAVVHASNLTINTTGNSARGLDATYDGTIIANGVNITTKGAHCAPLATDRGGGTITVTKGTLSASGDGSPCIYSTGKITASNVTGTAADSQCAVIEGKNSITLKSCKLTGAGKNGIMLYQSTSGDAEEGTCVFNAKGSTLKTTSAGAMFYVTNTDARVDLTNTKLKFQSGILIQAAGNNTNNWGKSGSNGGTLTFTTNSEKLKGDIQCDSISKVTLSFKNKTSFEGAIDPENAGSVKLTLSKDSTWKVTKDSYVDVITDKDTSLSNIKSNGHTITYDASNSANSWLNGNTITLLDGGKLTPSK